MPIMVSLAKIIEERKNKKNDYSLYENMHIM
jgi:hypothetical protein